MTEPIKFNATVALHPHEQPNGMVVTTLVSFVVLAKTEKQAIRFAELIATANFHTKHKIASCQCLPSAPFDVNGPTPYKA